VDNYKDFAQSTVAVAPVPATTDTKLTVKPGDGAKFPEPPFNAVVAPVNTVPVDENAEQLRVTAIEGDVFTIERRQAGSLPRGILAGDQIFAGVTAKTIADLAALVTTEAAARAVAVSAAEAAGSQGLVPTAVKTAAYEAKPGDYVPVDISGGSVAVALPNAPADKTRVGLKIVKIAGTPGSTSLTINRAGTDVFNIAGGSTALTLSAKSQGVLLQYQHSSGIWYVQTTDTPLNSPLGAAMLGGDGTIGGPGGSLVAGGSIIFAPAPSGDETGAADTAAIAAAMPAKGSLVLRANAPYFVTSLPDIGPEQGIICLGLPIVNMVGNGVCLHIHNAAMSTAGGEAEFTKNMPGRMDPFIIDGSKAGAKAVGVQIGDINDLTWHGPIVRHFTGAEAVGWLLKSEVAWCERNNLVGVSVNNTVCVQFDNGGAGTGAFDYSRFDFSIQALPKQHGLVMQNAIGLWGSNLRLSGNCFTAVGNTGVAWKLGADNSSVQILGSHIEVGLETDGTQGVGHITVERGTKAEVSAQGVLSYKIGGSVGWAAGNITQPDSRFAFSGIVNIDENLGQNKQGEGLNVLGGSTWSRGFTTVTEANVAIKVQSGDYFTATLASGVNTLKLENSTQGRARRILAVLTQPAAGEPATLSIAAPGNNLQGNAQVVSTAAGGSIVLQAAHSAVDVVELATVDGQHWYIRILGPRAAQDAFLGIIRPVYAASIIPSTESVIGTAFRAFFARCIVPVTGTLHDITVFNGTVVNGNHNAAVFDTGQAEAGHYTSLWESGSVAAAGENKPQVVGDPALAVTAGQHLMLAIMNSGTTHKFGEVPTASHTGWMQLPGSFAPTGGGASPKMLAQHNYAELKYAAIAEAEMEAQGSPPLAIIGRIV
jgi:hypothetical protein